jgi:hypothetical protein
MMAKMRKDKASRTGSPVLRNDGENPGQRLIEKCLAPDRNLPSQRHL